MKPTRKSVTLLVDADMVARRACAAHAQEIEWERDVWSYVLDVGAAKHTYTAQIEKLRAGAEASRVVHCLSDNGEYFRYDLWPSYKGGRGPKPPGYFAFREWIEEEHDSYLRPRLEADDILGILATHKAILATDELPVIWSGDKDLRQIPGLHLDADGVIPKVIQVSEHDGRLQHIKQTLMGDTTDNYPGCPGIGPKTADKFLATIRPGADWAGVWREVEKLFAKGGKSRDDMIVQARVARILQAEDYDFDTRQPILWNPPT